AFDLAQRALQIEAGIARLLRRDRTAGTQQAAAEHVVAGAVDGFDAEELVALVAEGRELPLLAVPAHHDAVVAGGEAHHLHLVRSLVAPEPRYAVIHLILAGEPRRHAAPVIGSILHRLQPERSAETMAGIERAIADRGDIRIGCQ